MTAATRWVLAIVGLLAANALAMAILLVTSSTGGAQVIPAYYDRAAHFDDAIDEARRSRELGWHADPRVDRRGVELVVRDRDGAPIAGARIRVSGYPRAHASRRVSLDLAAVAAGRYRAAGAIEVGWHDLTIVVEHGAQRFVQQVAVEVL